MQARFRKYSATSRTAAGQVSRYGPAVGIPCGQALRSLPAARLRAPGVVEIAVGEAGQGLP